MKGSMAKKIRIAFDTNVWVSFTIGKQLAILEHILRDKRFSVFCCEGIKNEYIDLVNRPELTKYVRSERTIETIDLIDFATQFIEIQSVVKASRDVKDDFLLALSTDAKLHYLITGDKDLLVLNPYQKTTILNFAAFLELFMEK